MSERERLDKIKSVIDSYWGSEDPFVQHDLGIEIIQQHVDFLVGKAEEKQKLEARVEELEKENKWLNGGWDVEIKMREKRDKKIDKLISDKQRYKQALEVLNNAAQNCIDTDQKLVPQSVVDVSSGALKGESEWE